MNELSGVSVFSHFAVEKIVFAHHAFFQGRGRKDRFKRRAGFKAVGDRAIAFLL